MATRGGARGSVTRRHVAEAAGVSEAVVSYVISNGPRNVAPATRERVLQAAQRLGYRPNAAARALRTNRTMTLGLLIPDAANAFYGALARAIEQSAFAHGYTILLANAKEDKQQEATQIRQLLDHQADGIIIVPCDGPTTWRGLLARSRTSRPRVPLVAIDRELNDIRAPQVLVDNERGAYDATMHLVGHGRRRIGCIAGPAGVHPTADRVAGWRRALMSVGIVPGDLPLLHGSFRRRDGYEAARRILAGEHHGRAVDGLFVTSDEQALGAVRAAHELGVAVAKDIAIVGFDGVDATAYSVPAITTVEQPLEDLASSAVDLLLAQIRGEPDPPSRTLLPTRLVVRESCGCPGGEAIGWLPNQRRAPFRKADQAVRGSAISGPASRRARSDDRE